MSESLNVWARRRPPVVSNWKQTGVTCLEREDEYGSQRIAQCQHCEHRIVGLQVEGVGRLADSCWYAAVWAWVSDFGRNKGEGVCPQQQRAQGVKQAACWKARSTVWYARMTSPGWPCACAVFDPAASFDRGTCPAGSRTSVRCRGSSPPCRDRARPCRGRRQTRRCRPRPGWSSSAGTGGASERGRTNAVSAGAPCRCGCHTRRHQPAKHRAWKAARADISGRAGPGCLYLA